ncbi:hypothetical protein KAH55_06255, partial [bacterium]|nr:hypothetical protein [bacterium]
EPGFTITKTTWQNFIGKFTDTISSGDTVLLSGSLPPGAPEDSYAQLIRIAHKKKAFSAIDSSGNALKHAIEAVPNLVKINHKELDDWATATFKTSVSLDKAAQKLIASGIPHVTITCGQNGARSFSNQKIWQTSFSKTIRTGINTVGCGDAFFGGLIAKLTDGKPLEETLAFATACGTANTLTPGAGVIQADDINNCLKSIITQKRS